ncbi:MAG: outer membrane protein [Parvicellaceae bacterium]|jgi:outer membrane protein
MGRQNIILILAVFLVTGFNVNAQTSYSLEEVKKTAIENSAAVKNARIDILIAEKKVWETKAIGLPQVNAEAGFQHFLDIPTQVMPARAFNPLAPEGQLIGVQFGTDYSVNAKLTVSQLLFDGRYLIGLQAIQMFKKVSDQGLVKTEKVAREEAEDAYYMVVVSAEQIKILGHTKEKLVKLKNDIQLLADEKMVEQTDADQMALNLSRLENNLTLAKKQNELATDLLKLKMGFAMSKQIQTTDSLATFIDGFNPGTYIDKQFNSGNNMDVQMLETQLVLDDLNIKNEKAAGMPSVSAFFQTQQQAYRNEFNFFANEPWYPANMWGVNVSVPIFSSGSRNSKMRQAELVRDKREVTIGSLKEGLDLQVKNAKVQLESSWDIMQNNKTSMGIAERILNNSQIKFKEGVISSTEFTQSENQYIVSQSDYINSAYQMLKAKLELDKLMNNE